jgi:hypothetical protein
MGEIDYNALKCTFSASLKAKVERKLRKASFAYIVLNGKMMSYKHKQVRVMFGTKKGEDGEELYTGDIRYVIYDNKEPIDVPNFEMTIMKELGPEQLTGLVGISGEAKVNGRLNNLKSVNVKKVNMIKTINGASVEVDVPSQIIRISSLMYLDFIECEKNGIKGRGYTYGVDGNENILTMSPSDAREVRKGLCRCAFENYFNIVYSESFLNRIMNATRNPLFKKHHVYVPVLVEYNKLYNPLTDKECLNLNSDTESLKVSATRANIKNYSLIRDAEEIGRKFSLFDDIVTVYLMTHEEISRSLGLDRFLRFTPKMIYHLLVGVLPDGQNDPMGANDNYREYFYKTAVTRGEPPREIKAAGQTLTAEEFSLNSSTYNSYIPLLDGCIKLRDSKDNTADSAANSGISAVITEINKLFKTEKVKTIEDCISLLQERIEELDPENIGVFTSLKKWCIREIPKISRYGISSIDSLGNFTANKKQNKAQAYYEILKSFKISLVDAQPVEVEENSVLATLAGLKDKEV